MIAARMTAGTKGRGAKARAGTEPGNDASGDGGTADAAPGALVVVSEVEPMPEGVRTVLADASRLVPYDRNARTHTLAQVEQIAASIQAFGFTNPVLVDERGGIIAGHGRVLGSLLLYSRGVTIRLPPDEPGSGEGGEGVEPGSLGRALPAGTVPVIIAAGWTDAQKRAYVLADNKIALNAGWDEGLLTLELDELKVLGFDLALTGFTDAEFAAMHPTAPVTGLTDKDAVPEPPKDPVSKMGDVWVLGRHRVMCGDSTVADDVLKLMGSADVRVPLLHADPPYGMGKEGDGVANDNLYREKLDAFQMDWWVVWRKFMQDNASAYIWGNAPDLWRLWYVGGLGESERLEFRNEIVWDKKSIPGMASPLMTQFPEATERCLHFQVGDQFIGNVNQDQYFEGWDEIRLYLEGEAKAAGLTTVRCREITGVQMYAHWFSKSQWSFISEKHYTALAKGTENFRRPYADLRKLYDEIKGGYRNHINGILGGMRSYFDNAHDTMRDVWEFPRVIGEDRHGHATPKPVAMMERCLRSSCPPDGVCIEPFGGSGSTLIAAEASQRVCFTMEMQPVYVDVIVKRWQNFTGKPAILEATGEAFVEVAPAQPVKEAA